MENINNSTPKIINSAYTLLNMLFFDFIKFKLMLVVARNVKKIYQKVSTIPAVKSEYILKMILLFTDINCEYIATNQINIFGLKIAILNP